jgi:OmcA/MtrC family decaheme c-type cytochrome
MGKRLILLSVLCLIMPLLFLGCEGDDGATGAAGAPGDPGPGALANETCVLCHASGKIADVGTVHDTTTGPVTAVITDASFNPVDNTASVTFTFAAEDVDGNPVAVDLTEPISATDDRLARLRFTIARLIPAAAAGDPDSWFFYGPRSHRNAAQLTDNGGGSYTFTFVDDVALDDGEVGYTHRVGIEIYNLPSGLRSVNPTFDWVPDGVTPLLTREIVTTAACNQCHNPLGYTPRFHGSRRVEIKHCVLCHNPNNDLVPVGDPAAAAAPIPFVKLVHGIHTGQDLEIFEDSENVGDFTEIHIPQDIRNCTKCHKGGADSDNWMTQPTIEACGSCHEAEGVVENPINFATGDGHLGGPQTNNAGCAGCHPPASIVAAMATENVTPNNQELPAGLSRFEYFIDDVAVDNTGVATVGFRITRDGAPFDLQTWEDGEGTTFTDRSPTFLLAWALPQDGIDAPAEYNNLNSPDPPSSSTGNGAGDAASISIGDLWTAGDITGNSAGYMATISTLPFPAGATMRAVALQSYFNQIVGVDNDVIGRHTPAVMAPVPGDAVRRQVVKSGYTNNNDPLTGQPEGCLECHETLELHGGSRVNNVQVCVFCHNPNKSSSGRTADPTEPFLPETVAAVGSDPLVWPEATNNFKNMIHGIHAATDRPYEFVRNRTNGRYYSPFGGGGEWERIHFPGDLRYCEKCHIEGTYRPENLPAGTLWNVERTTTGNPAETREDIIAARSSVPNLTDLVDSPIAGACYYCHDEGLAKSHILTQGGKLSIWPSVDTGSGATSREDALGLP